MSDVWFDDPVVNESTALPRRFIVRAAGVGGIAILLIAAFAVMLVPLIRPGEVEASTASSARSVVYQHESARGINLDVPASSAGLAATCDQRVQEALTLLEQTCLSLGLDRVCYGNDTLTAELAHSADLRFEQRGDVIPAPELRELHASPLDLATGEWGIAVFKLRAAMPRTVPGQAVTFLVFGDTSVYSEPSTLGGLHAFYFSTGLGSVECESVSLDGILVQTPPDSAVQLRANGVNITLAGVAFLRAGISTLMEIEVLEGAAQLIANGQPQELIAGQSAAIPVGGSNGLEAVGPASASDNVSEKAVQAGCLFGMIGCDGASANSIPATNANLLDETLSVPQPTSGRAVVAGPRVQAPNAGPTPIDRGGGNHAGREQGGGNSGGGSLPDHAQGHGRPDQPPGQSEDHGRGHGNGRDDAPGRIRQGSAQPGGNR